MTAERFPSSPSSVVKTVKHCAADPVAEVKRARHDNLLTAIRLDQSLAAPFPGVAKMPSALTMREKIQKIRAAHAQSLAALDAKVDVALTAVDAEAKKVVAALDIKLQEDIDAHKAEIHDLRDELNQMTNGGPPLESSDASKPSADGGSQG